LDYGIFSRWHPPSEYGQRIAPHAENGKVFGKTARPF
jgi:hypothetical protein